MKKVLPYALFSFVSLILSIVLSILLEFSLSNTWQASVALLLIFGPLWIFGWKTCTEIKGDHPLSSLGLRFCLILTLIGYFISVLAFFVIGW